MSELMYAERNYNVKLPARFRTGFVYKPISKLTDGKEKSVTGFEYFAKLRPVVERFSYLMDGYAESTEDAHRQLELALQDFDPAKDLLIPAGSASAATQVGTIVARYCQEKGYTAYMMATYANGQYSLWWIPLDRSEAVFQFELEGLNSEIKN